MICNHQAQQITLKNYWIKILSQICNFSKKNEKTETKQNRSKIARSGENTNTIENGNYLKNVKTNIVKLKQTSKIGKKVKKIEIKWKKKLKKI